MKKFKKEMWGYIFLIPWFAFFAVFTAYPFCFGIYVSFTNYTLGAQDFIGLKNYKDIFFDPAFFKSVVATFEYVLLILPSTVIVSLWVSKVLQYRGPKMNAFTKVAFYLPTVTSQVALVIVWQFLFAPSFGFIASLFVKAGLQPISWFDNANYAIPMISFLVVAISLGQPIILYTAAINGIPESYFEAAEIDGAKRNQVFFKITLPLLQATTTFIIITSTIALMQIFVVPYLMTGGGPEYRTSSLLLMIYRAAFGLNKFGYASAIGVIFFVITGILAAVQFKMMKRENIEY